jgi:DNA methylase
MRSKSLSREDVAEAASVVLDKERWLEVIGKAASAPDIVSLKHQIRVFRSSISDRSTGPSNGERLRGDGSTVSFHRELLISELDQVLESRTIERARYYLRRLEKGTDQVRTGKVNDINLHRWKEYQEIITDSLWALPKRDTSGAHLGWYWGNFVPQIPRQMMLRYTKKGDWVLDPFLGSGTTLIECRRLGRNGIGIELSDEIANKAADLVEKQACKTSTETRVITADSRTFDLRATLAEYGQDRLQLLIMHPPYHDIIRFTGDERDLSNAGSTDDFLRMFATVLDNVGALLEKGRYLAVVIGDKYSAGEWVPLGFMCMNEVIERSYLLKSIVVKNFDETRAKREQKQLWRYRALVGGFYIFKHEYILLFQKR